MDIHEGYLDMPSAPHYGALELERENVDVGGEARASLAVTNTGGRHGTAVVQLYDADTGTGVTLPALQRWIRPGRPRAGCIEVGEPRRPDGSARLHGTLRRVRQRARSGGANRGQQLERDPIQRHVR